MCSILFRIKFIIYISNIINIRKYINYIRKMLSDLQDYNLFNNCVRLNFLIIDKIKYIIFKLNTKYIILLFFLFDMIQI